MVTQTSVPEQSLGRPRDPRIDEAVLAAVRALLLEVGYEGLSLTVIAERAGTTRPALSRRWPSLPHLVHEAAFPSDLRIPRSEADSDPDVRGMVAGALAAFSAPVARAAAPGLVAAITADPCLHRALLERFSAALGGIEQPLLDLVAGAAFFALLLHPEDLIGSGATAWVDQVTALLEKGAP